MTSIKASFRLGLTAIIKQLERPRYNKLAGEEPRIFHRYVFSTPSCRRLPLGRHLFFVKDSTVKVPHSGKRPDSGHLDHTKVRCGSALSLREGWILRRGTKVIYAI